MVVFLCLVGRGHAHPVAWRYLTGALGPYEIDHGEDDDPYDVDEVPVEPCQFNIKTGGLGDLTLLEGGHDEGPKPDDADGDMGAMEAS